MIVHAAEVVPDQEDSGARPELRLADRVDQVGHVGRPVVGARARVVGFGQQRHDVGELAQHAVADVGDELVVRRDHVIPGRAEAILGEGVERRPLVAEVAALALERGRVVEPTVAVLAQHVRERRPVEAGHRSKDAVPGWVRRVEELDRVGRQVAGDARAVPVVVVAAPAWIGLGGVVADATVRS